MRNLASAKDLDLPALTDHVPTLLDELATALESMADESESEKFLQGSPPIHGRQRYEDEFDIVEVVAEYNLLRACIYDLAEEHGLSLHGTAFHILNRVFDEAIGLAVQTFAARQALAVQRRREEYLAFVAHDLRTPLNAISLAADVLEASLSRGGDRGHAERMLKTLKRNVQNLEDLLKKLLAESGQVQMSRVARPELGQFDLWPLAEQVIRDLQPVAGTAGTELLNRVPEHLSVYADADLLKRVLQNLVANAIAYTPRGEVAIGAQVIGARGAFKCWVSDNGAGIPADRLETIFDRQTTDPERPGGTGLGLAIVKKFVEAHGGEVNIESEFGRGSTVRFRLPGEDNAAGA